MLVRIRSYLTAAGRTRWEVEEWKTSAFRVYQGGVTTVLKADNNAVRSSALELTEYGR